jgi:DNA-directed RNA polymerase subunit RPC12/RpoP
MQAECALCHKTWKVVINDYGIYACPYCTSLSIKLVPLVENKEQKQPKQKTE